METGGRGPAVDAAAIEELERSVGDDREFLRELVETYLDDAPAQVAAMREGLATGDLELARRGAHTLKSNSASMGAVALAEMCRETEAVVGHALADDAPGETAALQTRVASISAELERVMADLDALVPATEA